MKVFLLLSILTTSACFRSGVVDSRIIISKRYIGEKYLLPELKINSLAENSSQLWKNVHTNFLQKNYKKIESDMRKFLQNRPAHPTALSILMKSLFLQKKYELAKYYARFLLTVDKDNSDAHMIINLSVIVASDSYHYQRRAAELKLASIFEDNKRHIASGLNLAIWMLKKGNCKKAMDLFSKVSNRCPGCGVAKIGHAICLVRTNNIISAHQILLDINSNTDDALARYYLAFTYLKIEKDLRKAKDILKDIVANKSQDGYIRNKARSLLILIQSQNVVSRKGRANSSL